VKKNARRDANTARWL